MPTSSLGGSKRVSGAMSTGIVISSETDCVMVGTSAASERFAS